MNSYERREKHGVPRYSGRIAMRVVLREGMRDEYHVSIKLPNGDRETVVVGAPAHMRIAIDSPQAYDDAARAALAFAEHDGLDVAEHAEFDESSYVIRRIKR